jgi:hypothetical protein
MERYSGRPTLGCPGNDKGDPPIYLRSPNVDAKLINIEDFAPIGRKSHFLRELIRHDLEEEQAGVILITRDPEEAIMSHLYPLLKPSFMRRRVKAALPVRKAVDEYLAMVFAFRGMFGRNRIHLKLEDLISSPLETSRRLLSGMGLQPNINERDISETLALAKESLERPANARRDVEVADVIRREIRKRITYSEVLEWIRCDEGQQRIE